MCLGGRGPPARREPTRKRSRLRRRAGSPRSPRSAPRRDLAPRRAARGIRAHGRPPSARLRGVRSPHQRLRRYGFVYGCPFRSRSSASSLRLVFAFGRTSGRRTSLGAMPRSLSVQGSRRNPRVRVRWVGTALRGGAWARSVVRMVCARAPSLILVRDPWLHRVSDMMVDGVIPLGEALRPLGLSGPSTWSWRQERAGSWPRRIWVTKGLARTGRVMQAEARPRRVRAARDSCASTACARPTGRRGSLRAAPRPARSTDGRGFRTARRTAPLRTAPTAALAALGG